MKITEIGGVRSMFLAKSLTQSSEELGFGECPQSERSAEDYRRKYGGRGGRMPFPFFPDVIIKLDKDGCLLKKVRNSGDSAYGRRGSSGCHRGRG